MLIFIVLAICGFFVLSISLLFGHDVDHGVDHYFGDHGHGTSLFSTTIISLFMTGFGASGAIAAYYQWSTLAASMVGVVFGFCLGGLGYFLSNLFYKQQADSLVRTSELIGQVGTVTVGIAPNGIGEVTIHFKGQTFYYSAKTRDGSPASTGSTAKIIDNVAGTVLVEPLK